MNSYSRKSHRGVVQILIWQNLNHGRNEVSRPPAAVAWITVSCNVKTTCPEAISHLHAPSRRLVLTVFGIHMQYKEKLQDD